MTEHDGISAAGWVRIVGRLAAALLLLIVLLPFHYLWRAFVYGSPIPMLFLRWTARIFGARVSIIGDPRKRDVFYIANHVSWMDILSLAGASGTAFVAKQELDDTPIVGWLSRLNRTVFVDREDRLGIANQIDMLREALKDNWSVTVFPEGTTGDGESLLPFKTAMLQVLEPAPEGVSVQPVFLDYGELSRWIGWVGDETGVDNFKRVLARRGSFPLRIHFLEPFDPGETPGRKAIGKRAEAAIRQRLDECLRERPTSQQPISG